MRVDWTVAALADVEACVPEGFRPAMLDHLQRLGYVGQGRPCASERYLGHAFVKFRHWLVMYLPLDEQAIGVVAVEYNYGQEP